MSAALPPLVARAAAYRARTAIIDGQATYSYDDLERASSGIASQLSALNGARVAFLVAPSFAHVAVQWGIWRAGGIAVPLPMSHPTAELDYVIRDAESALVIADAANAELVAPIARSAGARFFRSDDLLTGPSAESSPEGFSPAHDAARPAMILYTSGTTSRPKGVVTTHAAIAAQIESLVERLGMDGLRPYAARSAAASRARHHQRRLFGPMEWCSPRDAFELRRRSNLGSPGVRSTDSLHRGADDLSPADSVLGVSWPSDSHGALAGLPDSPPR